MLITMNEVKLSSLDFLKDYINPARLMAGEPELRNTELLRKIEDECDDLGDKQKICLSTRPTYYYMLTKDQMLMVGMRECKEVRKAVKRKLDSMEAKQPSFLENISPAAMIMLEDLNRQLNESKQETSRLQNVCNTMASQFQEGMTPPAFCKQLNGVNTQQVNNWLVAGGHLARTSAGLVPTAYTRDRYFKYSRAEKGRRTDDYTVTTDSVTLTKLGAKWIYKHYLNGKMPMKANWNGEFSHELAI